MTVRPTIGLNLKSPSPYLSPALVRIGGATLLLLGGGCAPALTPDPHYVLGKPYQAGSVWFYPRESFDLDETGLAATAPAGAPRLATDGELFDQHALGGGHPTIQLPAIARLTNLDNGRTVVIRLNDRGTGDPHRMVQITRRTAQLLGAPPNGLIHARLQVLPNESHAAADALPGAPILAVTAAPRGTVEVADLPVPAGVRRADANLSMTEPTIGQLALHPPALPATAMPHPPMSTRLSETVTQVPVRPQRLAVRLDTFDTYHYAAVQRAKMSVAGARIVTVGDRRTHQFRVEIGPLPDIAHADAVLDQAFASGIPDARIVLD